MFLMSVLFIVGYGKRNNRGGTVRYGKTNPQIQRERPARVDQNERRRK